MATRAQLVREILKELGVHQAGQDLPPEDFRAVDERLPFEIATLASERIYTLGNIESVPDEALVPLARYLAGQFTQVFGIAGEELQAVLTNQAAGEATLRFLRTRGPTYAIMRTESF